MESAMVGGAYFYFSGFLIKQCFDELATILSKTTKRLTATIIYSYSKTCFSSKLVDFQITIYKQF